ncbi:YfdQ family protein [Salmonella enterica]|nr:YfdQ family protein [Salmonella enterica]
MSQLDNNAIQEIVNLSTAAFYPDPIKHTDCPAVLVPSGVNTYDLEHLMANRYRFRGDMNTTCIEDFVQYSKGYAGEGVRCFIDADVMSATTVFNIGTLDKPGHADNCAHLQLKKTSPFRSLLEANGTKYRQKKMAEWIEDWSDFLTAYDSEDKAMDIKQAASTIRKITIEAKRNASYEDQDMSASRSVMESVEAKNKDKEVMPSYFEFECIPYEGLANRKFRLRFSILTSDEPILVVRIVQLEAKEEEIAKEFRDLLKEKFAGQQIETFIGDFSA